MMYFILGFICGAMVAVSMIFFALIWSAETYASIDYSKGSNK